MARGPFQGTHVGGVRPTIVTAPDALVYINGNSEAVTCSKCRKKFPFNKYITSIQTDLSIDSSPGSASISLSIPRHAVDDFVFDGEPIVTPMMEIEIFAKGHFLVEGLPQYYPIFWGLVTEVTDDYSGGEQTFTIHCADILKWWELCKMAVNSAFTSPSPGAKGMSLLGNVFYGANPYDMIWTLAQQSFGDIVVGTGSLVNFIAEKGSQEVTFQTALHDIMLYWNERFTRMRSNLLLYGTQGVAVRGDTLYATAKAGKSGLKDLVSRAVAQANGGPDAGQMIFDPTDPGVVAFKTVVQIDVPFWQSEYQTKLELATATKEAIGFEFFMDVDGSIVFKPPFYNLDILGNKPVSWIQDIDIIDSNFSSSESEVVTQIQMQGSLTGNEDWGLGDITNPTTTVTDYHLLRQYGWRTQTINSEFLNDPVKMYYHGMDMLDRLNSRRHRGSVSIPVRPELRLGMPIYVASKDQMWYTQGISHSIAFGGRATTSLTLTARRKKWIAPTGTGTVNLIGFDGKANSTSSDKPAVRYSSRQLQKGARFEVKIEDAATIPQTSLPDPLKPSPYEPLILRHPKTGRIVGFPNAVMVYTRPVLAPDNVVKKNAGQRTTKSPVSNKDFNKQAKVAYDKVLEKSTNGIDDESGLRERLMTNRYTYGVNSAGAFVYARDASKTIEELLLLPVSRIKITPSLDGTTDAAPFASGMIRPVSDDRGFELVGHFRYGRGVSLRDGRLVLRDGQANEPAQISTQVALAGDLYAALTAQSKGLSSVTTQYGNPADVLANLTVEDEQTAGFINPDTKDPVWSDKDDHYIRARTLNSPEQQGVEQSLEATQLSRALTLAEMTIIGQEGNVDEDCPCLLGRPELSFMASGYSVKTIEPGAVDNSDLSGASLFNPTSTSQALPLRESDFDPATKEGALGKINTFLFSLYEALDEPHQEYEKALRGGNLPVDPNAVDDIRFGSLTNTIGDPTPPFSAPNRYKAGDPRAIAVQMDSASNDLRDQWGKFSKNLEKSASSKQLTSEIANDRANLTKALADKDLLLQQGNQTTIGGQSLSKLNTQIAGLQQDIANKQAQLDKL